MNDIFIARQPVYSESLDVVFYELLYRHARVNSAELGDVDQATAQLVVNAFMNLEFDTVARGYSAFINISEHFIDGMLDLPLPKNRVILSVVPTKTLDDELLVRLQHAAEKGHAVAMDLETVKDCDPRQLTFLQVLEVDISQCSLDGLADELEKYRVCDCRFLAKKIETLEAFERCKALGFDLFQGYFLYEPQLIEGKRQPGNRMAMLNLLASLQDPHITNEKLAELISMDVTLTYRILHYLNSPYFNLSNTISSVREAIFILGQNVIRSWVSLLLMAGVDNKPTELVVTGLVRGRMAQNIAQKYKKESVESYFLAGLFSVLPALLDQTVEDLVQRLPLTSAINEALLLGEGEIGEVLTYVIAFEQGLLEDPPDQVLSREDINQAYMDAVSWSDVLADTLSRED